MKAGVPTSFDQWTTSGRSSHVPCAMLLYFYIANPVATKFFMKVYAVDGVNWIIYSSSPVAELLDDTHY